MAAKKDENKEKKPRGRPAKYDPAILPKLYKFCLLHAKDEQIADFLEIDMATLYRWKGKYTDFCDTIARGKEIADMKVAESMYNRAVGYKQKAVKIFYSNDLAKSQILYAVEQGTALPDELGVIRAEYIERFPPDYNSAAFWLANRQKESWKLKSDVSVNATASATAVHNITWEEAPGCEPLRSPAEIEKDAENV